MASPLGGGPRSGSSVPSAVFRSVRPAAETGLKAAASSGVMALRSPNCAGRSSGVSVSLVQNPWKSGRPSGSRGISASVAWLSISKGRADLIKRIGHYLQVGLTVFVLAGVYPKNCGKHYWLATAVDLYQARFYVKSRDFKAMPLNQ